MNNNELSFAVHDNYPRLMHSNQIITPVGSFKQRSNQQRPLFTAVQTLNNARQQSSLKSTLIGGQDSQPEMLHHPNVNSFSFSKQTNNPHIHHSSSSGAQIIYESVAGIGGAAITTAANSPGDFMNGKLLQNRQSQRLISEKSQLERP